MIQEDFKIGTGSNIKKELSTAMLGFKDTKLHVDILVNLFWAEIISNDVSNLKKQCIRYHYINIQFI